MNKLLLLGDEAVALAAMDSGLSGAFGYPGTPSTEIFEYLQMHAKEAGFTATWSANEKIAVEEALGMSYIGKRSVVTMKSVGLNVAADPFMCSAITGANGGLVYAVADDPGMHSSQNEQDSRYYAAFAQLPCYEPTNQQEAYSMTREAFEFSEKHKTPVLLRLVTRIAHSRSEIIQEPKADRHYQTNQLSDPQDWILLPGYSRRKFPLVLEKVREITQYSNKCKWNYIHRADDRSNAKKGVICSSSAYEYLKDSLNHLNTDVDYLKISFYPFPVALIKEFVEGKDEILVLEDGYPLIEERLLGLIGRGPAIHGRIDYTIDTCGEISPDKTLTALHKIFGFKLDDFEPYRITVPNRPPKLCKGCPHIDSYNAINGALKGIREDAKIFGDIGCYTLGALPPHLAIDACVEMGGSIGMAAGAAKGGLKYSIAVIGDSTFEHSGLGTLATAAKDNTNMTVVILDNGTTAMTGMQQSLANDEQLASLIAGLGVAPEHIKTIKPLPSTSEENVKTIRAELEYKGLSVILSRRDCIQILVKK